MNNKTFSFSNTNSYSHSFTISSTNTNTHTNYPFRRIECVKGLRIIIVKRDLINI